MMKFYDDDPASSSVHHQFFISSSSMHHQFIIILSSVHHQFIISSSSVRHQLIFSSSSANHHLFICNHHKVILWSSFSGISQPKTNPNPIQQLGSSSVHHNFVITSSSDHLSIISSSSAHHSKNGHKIAQNGQNRTTG